jgi:hypothetical protein
MSFSIRLAFLLALAAPVLPGCGSSTAFSDGDGGTRTDVLTLLPGDAGLPQPDPDADILARCGMLGGPCCHGPCAPGLTCGADDTCQILPSQVDAGVGPGR